MEVKHTPGPWQTGKRLRDVKNGGEFKALKAKNTGIWIGDLRANGDEDDANIALIAAAPDLLAACKELEESAAYWSEYDVPLGIVGRLKAAIAKATS